MFQTVVATLHENQNAVANKPAFASALHHFEERLNQLEQLLNDHAKDMGWVTSEKTSTVNSAVESAYLLMKIVKAYGDSIGDESLQSKMNFRKRDFTDNGTLGMINAIHFVIQEASAIEEELVAFGINATMISDLIALHDKLIILNNAPRLAIISRKLVTKQIDVLEKELVEDLRVVFDPFVELLKDEFPALHAKYKEARHTKKPVYKSSASGQVPPEPDDGK